jgi:gamma-glutamyltranspeptidase/glutathione hydrolase
MQKIMQKIMQKKFIHILMLGLVLLYSNQSLFAESQPLSAIKPAVDVEGKGGMVTADHALASQIGVDILKKGGDSVDAAVAVSLALGVLQPFASGLGGGGFAVIWRQKEQEKYALDFREVAPLKATADMYLDAQKQLIPKASTEGPLAVAVPGELAGLYALHQKHGKLPWQDVVAPALALARDGFEMHELLHERLIEVKDRILVKSPILKSWFFEGDAPKKLGQKVHCPELANSLKLIAQEGAQTLYQGTLGQMLVDAIQKDGGILSKEDLNTYMIKQREVLHARLNGKFNGIEILTMPPPSSGGVVLLQVLKVFEKIDLALLKDPLQYLHLLAESFKHAFADRAQYLGDPDFIKVPTQAMLSEQRIQEIIQKIDLKQTLNIDQYGGKYQLPTDGGTSHFNVIDAQGNAVALTTTINTTFGSLYVAGQTGLLMNNEMDDFVAQPNVPNAFGLVGNQANAIQAKKRPLSSMSPTIILKDGKVKAMVGASGGPTIITSTLQVLMAMILFEKTPATAVNAFRIHHQWKPNKLLYDQGLDQQTITSLTSKQHETKAWIRFSATQALIVQENGVLIGASDPTKRGKAAVVEFNSAK